jgi:hypothetical protein
MPQVQLSGEDHALVVALQLAPFLVVARIADSLAVMEAVVLDSVEVAVGWVDVDLAVARVSVILSVILRSER